MKPTDDRPDSAAEPEAEEEVLVPRWNPPHRSDQAPGEEVVQVNDAYAGGGPPPEAAVPHENAEQHPTGG
jgi:hypothetical protein